MATFTLLQQYADLLQVAAAREANLHSLHEQRLKLEAEIHADHQQEATIAEKLVESVNGLSGGKFRLVRKDAQDDGDGYETADAMEKEWHFKDVVTFLRKHQCILLTNTINENKKLVFALFPLTDAVSYIASDIVLAQTMLSITKLIRASSGSFDMLTICKELKVSIPRGKNSHCKTTMSTYCGSVVATQNCPRGCDFCAALFKYDKRRAFFGNNEPSGEDDDDEVPAKKRCKQSSSSD